MLYVTTEIILKRKKLSPPSVLLKKVSPQVSDATFHDKTISTLPV